MSLRSSRVILGDAMGIPLAFTFSWAGVGLWLLSVIVIAVRREPAARVPRLTGERARRDRLRVGPPRVTTPPLRGLGFSTRT